MKKLFTLFAAVVAALAMNATKVTFDFSDASAYGYDNPVAGSYTQVNNGDVITKDGVTITVGFTSGNGVRFYANQNSGVINLREYVGSTLTIAAPAGSKINAINFDGTNLTTTYMSGDVTSKDWTGDASSLTINFIKSTVQINSMVVTLDETATIDTITGTIGEIRAMQAQEMNTTDYFQTSGTVGTILSAEYGNYYLHDGNDSVMVYGTLDANGDSRNFASLGINEGDNITIVGKMKMYNSTLEFVDVKVLSGAQTATVDTITVAEAMTKGMALANNTESEKVVVIGYVVKAYTYGEKYAGAQTGFMADEVGAFGEFELYNCNVAAPGFAEGDKVAVAGKILKYVSQDGTKTTIEIKNGDVEVIEHATGLNDIEVEKAVKTIENGQLIIIRNGVKYNVQGAQL